MSFFIDRPFVRGTQGHRRRPFIGGLSFGDRRGRPGAGRGGGATSRRKRKPRAGPRLPNKNSWLSWSRNSLMFCV